MLGRVFSSNLGKVLVTLLVIGVAGSTVSYGTFASFTAQTSNSGNTFSTGTLVLKNDIAAGANVGASCLSTASGVDANSSGCLAFFAEGAGAGLAPGGTNATATITLTNQGSLAAGSLKIWSNACSATDNSAVSVHGSGDPCDKLVLTVFDGTNCVYPSATGACVASSTKTLKQFVTDTSSTPISASGLAAAGSRSYTIGVGFDSTAGNSYQGRTASTTFSWRLDQ